MGGSHVSSPAGIEIVALGNIHDAVRGFSTVKSTDNMCGSARHDLPYTVDACRP
ncbi:hypothetical protein PAXRUDRAFT_822786 [Paxillus rubicundulus Ve08.2h10]|uniref:Uncharacterized protein n=1 Tax=Paxillus rubicundulus Ve08.2h10 TaxID=930991 RepID=A0A0D0E4T1_9AGAM|nr:hypothetical protein PAXRUDRAFT_822786 [Paxillus rubicundulus Ve08.2h10]